MRHQRRDAAIEQPFDEALAFAEQPGLALQHGGVEVPPAFAGGREVARQAGAMGAADIVRWTRANLPR